MIMPSLTLTRLFDGSALFDVEREEDLGAGLGDLLGGGFHGVASIGRHRQLVHGAQLRVRVRLGGDDRSQHAMHDNVRVPRKHSGWKLYEIDTFISWTQNYFP